MMLMDQYSLNTLYADLSSSSRGMILDGDFACEGGNRNDPLESCIDQVGVVGLVSPQQ